ncbi:hypothetical protein [Parachlamydia sp. AcF125]|uniref:hypothetical protein n=1 Tax=Parachlamydia sp. AcF125 TaxID=2795736 RepID=UPI001BC8EC53|nr:hypothetical protein [Parachlamydia sp. AcF125]MBS4168627.1 hypothetical protein [Parachlamydia sp. AcF125]
MPSFLKIFSFLCTLLLMSSSLVEGKERVERLLFSFDNREWKAGFQRSDPISSITEYTLNDEAVDNWTELVTVQKLVPITISAYEYYAEFIKSLKKGVNPAEVKSNVLKQKENDLLFEWAIPGNGPLAQHEWFRLIKTPQSTWVLRYTTKKLNEVEKQRPIWEKILDSAFLECSGEGK